MNTATNAIQNREEATIHTPDKKELLEMILDEKGQLFFSSDGVIAFLTMSSKRKTLSKLERSLILRIRDTMVKYQVGGLQQIRREKKITELRTLIKDHSVSADDAAAAGDHHTAAGHLRDAAAYQAELDQLLTPQPEVR